MTVVYLLTECGEDFERIMSFFNLPWSAFAHILKKNLPVAIFIPYEVLLISQHGFALFLCVGLSVSHFV